MSALTLTPVIRAHVSINGDKSEITPLHALDVEPWEIGTTAINALYSEVAKLPDWHCGDLVSFAYTDDVGKRRSYILRMGVTEGLVWGHSFDVESAGVAA